MWRENIEGHHRGLFLNKDEKVELCRCVTEGGADFIKTSTGFGSGGATLEDVQLFKKAYWGHMYKLRRLAVFVPLRL